MNKVAYERNGKVLTNLANGERPPFKSVNAAKRASRKLQMELDGALGRGSVRRID